MYALSIGGTRLISSVSSSATRTSTYIDAHEFCEATQNSPTASLQFVVPHLQSVPTVFDEVPSTTVHVAAGRFEQLLDDDTQYLPDAASQFAVPHLQSIPTVFEELPLTTAQVAAG